jgi:hypothetical protein
MEMCSLGLWLHSNNKPRFIVLLMLLKAVVCRCAYCSYNGTVCLLFIHVYIYRYTYVYIYVYICIQLDAHMYSYIYTYMYTCVHIYMYI